MVFTLKSDKITKKMLLEYRTEEEYMTFYLGMSPDKEMHRNPFRVDRNPTCTFYRSGKGELIFKDWKTGWHANFVDVVMQKFNVGFGKAISIIANDFNIVESNLPKNKAAATFTGELITHKSSTYLQAEIREFTDDEIKWWDRFGITPATLKKYNTYSIKNVFLNGNLVHSTKPAHPIFGYYFGKEDERELWKFYFPTKIKYRFMLNTNKLQGAKQLPATGDVVVVTKSMKDVMCFYEMGIPAVAPQAESVLITQRQYDALKKRFKRVVFNGDWDGAGQKFMFESRKKYSGIALAFTNKAKHAKDVSDFVKKFGKERAHKFIRKVYDKVMNGDFDKQLSYCKS